MSITGHFPALHRRLRMKRLKPSTRPARRPLAIPPSDGAALSSPPSSLAAAGGSSSSNSPPAILSGELNGPEVAAGLGAGTTRVSHASSRGRSHSLPPSLPPRAGEAAVERLPREGVAPEAALPR